MEKTSEELKLRSVIWLVALPGGLVAALYFVAAPVFVRLGFPSLSALLLSIVLVLVPFEIGVLLREGKKLNGRFTLRGAVPWTEPMPALLFSGLVAALLVWNFTVFVLFARFDHFLLERLFFWFPQWALPPLNLYPAPNAYSPAVTSAVVAAGLIVAGVIAPVVEELYFRGFLLPRMRFAGRYAPLLNAVLFSAYHLTFPWQLVSRAIAVAPVAYVAARTKNVYVGMVTHVLLNAGTALLLLLLGRR